MQCRCIQEGDRLTLCLMHANAFLQRHQRLVKAARALRARLTPEAVIEEVAELDAALVDGGGGVLDMPGEGLRDKTYFFLLRARELLIAAPMGKKPDYDKWNKKRFQLLEELEPVFRPSASSGNERSG